MTHRRRRALLVPLALILAPLSVAGTAWRLLVGADQPRVVNGLLVLAPAGWAEAVVTALCWAWAVTAGVVVLGGVGGGRPLRRALSVLPTAVGLLLAAVVVMSAALLLLGLVLPADPALFWAIVLMLALPAAAVLVRLALAFPVAVIDGVRGVDAVGTASARAKGMVWSLGILLLLGLAVPALLAGWILGRAEHETTGRVAGVTLWLIRDATWVAVAALQAATLVAAYRNLRREAQPETAMRDAAPERRQSAVRRLAVAGAVVALLLPTALAGGVVASERLPQVTVVPRSDRGMLIALGWPAGRPPIILGQSTIYDCLDDDCRATKRTKLTVTMMESIGGAAIAADGSIFALGQHELEHCDAQRICRRADGDIDALAGSEHGAIALAPDGQILIATATATERPRPDQKSRPWQPEDLELRLVRCRDVHCGSPTVTSLGVVPRVREERGRSSPYHRPLLVGTDRAGRPVVTFRSPDSTVWVARCETSACPTAQLALQAKLAPPGLPGDEELALHHFDRLLHCTRNSCDQGPVATADRPGGGIYGVAIEPAPTGVRVQVGEPAAAPRRAVLWSCADHTCDDPRRIPLVEVPQWSSTLPGPSIDDFWLLAANPDGRVVLASPHTADRIVTVRP